MNIFKCLKRGINRIRKYTSTPYEWAILNGVKIGKHCFIASKDHWPSEGYLVTIGDYCQITEGVRIHTHGGGQVVRDTIPNFDCFGKVNIGDYVYIGALSQIMPGVNIGDHVLISAGSIVTKSIPSGVVVGGNPARIICTVEKYAKRNQEYNVGTKLMTTNQKKEFLLNLPEEKFVRKAEIY